MGHAYGTGPVAHAPWPMATISSLPVSGLRINVLTYAFQTCDWSGFDEFAPIADWTGWRDFVTAGRYSVVGGGGEGVRGFARR